MPIYEFQCSKCENAFEVIFRTAAEELKVSCPRCKSKKVHRVLSSLSPRPEKPKGIQVFPKPAHTCGHG